MRGATEALPPDDRREGRLAVEGALTHKPEITAALTPLKRRRPGWPR
jgi:hypothetical protein